MRKVTVNLYWLSAKCRACAARKHVPIMKAKLQVSEIKKVYKLRRGASWDKATIMSLKGLFSNLGVEILFYFMLFYQN